MNDAIAGSTPRLDPLKFRDPLVTAKGETRARVALKSLDTLWFNTGTLCNLTCRNCYIESSPKNDRLVYLSAAEVAAYLDEIAALGLGTKLIGFTGGEPFMNRDLIAMLEDALSRGHDAIVLTNAMKPMQYKKRALLALRERYGAKSPGRLTIRVSLDHYGAAVHELERGKKSWCPSVDGLKWLADNGFAINVASRYLSGESEAAIRDGFRRLFTELGVTLDASDPVALMIFPEMDATVDVPEITTACWDILHKSPDSVMCASSRMVVKHKGAARPTVAACTLLPYDALWDFGPGLAGALGAVPLNHPHCAKFCVLGGAACSA
ncbi:MAG TPA: radical SAM protein [Stellaceae bacterium]|nr:radical SAM protein [Stellaceae bacterium]